MSVVVPPTVARVLAKHGRVSFSVFRRPIDGFAELAVAPLDELLVFFAPSDSAVLKALQAQVEVRVTATGEEESFRLRCRGRAIATGRAMAHPRRNEFVHWLPDDGAPQDLVAIEFVPEEISFSRTTDSGKPESFEGATPAKPRPGGLRRWLTVSYSGMTWALILAVVFEWGWIGWFGQDYRLRLLCLALALFATFALVGGARALYRAAALRGFQAGRVRREAAGVLGEAWLARDQVVRVGWSAIGVGVGILLVVGAIWGWTVAGVVALSTQLWFFGPLWLLHVNEKSPEPKA